MGLTPKLSWDYQKSTSNHAFIVMIKIEFISKLEKYFKVVN